MSLKNASRPRTLVRCVAHTPRNTSVGTYGHMRAHGGTEIVRVIVSRCRPADGPVHVVRTFPPAKVVHG